MTKWFFHKILVVAINLKLTRFVFFALTVATSCNYQKTNKMDEKNDTEVINMKAPLLYKTTAAGKP